MKDDALSVIGSEFKLWGVKFEHRETDGNHIELRWQASPDKEIRRHFIAKTPSDWRGTLNSRAHIRRLFRADGLNLNEEIKKPKPVLHKALEMPAPVETDAQQIKMLRGEVADLTDLMLDLCHSVALLKGHLMPSLKELIELPAQPEAAVEAPAVSVVVQKPRSSHAATRRVVTLDHVTNIWRSTEEIAKSMGLKKPVAYMKLQYLKQKGVLQLSEGYWRRVPLQKVNGARR